MSLDKMNAENERVISLVLRITNPDDAKAIWEAHKDQSLFHGCYIMAIADGDLIMENQILEANLNE